MAAPLTLRLVSGSELKERAPARFELRTPLGDLRIVVASPGFLEALERLVDPGANPHELKLFVEERDGTDAGEILQGTLNDLERRGLLCHRIWSRGLPWVTGEPIAPGWRNPPLESISAGSFVLSRFAFARTQGGRLVLASPLSHMRVILHDGRASRLLSRLAVPTDTDELIRSTEGVEAESVRQLPVLLHGAAMLSKVDGAGRSDEEQDPALRQWEFHDLLFHGRSRQGRHSEPYGGSYRFRGLIDPLPAAKPRAATESIALARPDVDALSRTDAPFTRILEQRRTHRAQGSRPITRSQVGEFLYRVAAVRAVDREGEYEAVRGVYPTAGGTGELELYTAIDRCDGLEPGLYAYDAHGHRLDHVSTLTHEVERLLDGAGRAAAGPRPQLLIVIAARFQRMAWKYASVGYANVLKDVGGLFQTMYLVATSMGLAGCAIGGGDSDRFARAAGTDYRVETSVGEFMLGSAADACDAQ